MACKSCQERREWLARYRKETGASASKALLALYRKGKESGRTSVEGVDSGAVSRDDQSGEDPVRVALGSAARTEDDPRGDGTGQ